MRGKRPDIACSGAGGRRSPRAYEPAKLICRIVSCAPATRAPRPVACLCLPGSEDVDGLHGGRAGWRNHDKRIAKREPKGLGLDLEDVPIFRHDPVRE